MRKETSLYWDDEPPLLEKDVIKSFTERLLQSLCLQEMHKTLEAAVKSSAGEKVCSPVRTMVADMDTFKRP